MANKIKFKRGNTSNRIALTPVPANGEPIWDSEAKQLYVGDGVTPGGVAVTGTEGSAGSHTHSGLDGTPVLDPTIALDQSKFKGNLLPNSSFRFGSKYWTGVVSGWSTPTVSSRGEEARLQRTTNNATGADIEVVSDPISVYTVNTKLVLSADIANPNTTAGPLKCRLSAYSPTGTELAYTEVAGELLTASKRYSGTLTLPSGVSNIKVRCICPNGFTQTGGGAAVARIKVELDSGSGKPSPYSFEADLLKVVPGTAADYAAANHYHDYAMYDPATQTGNAGFMSADFARMLNTAVDMAAPDTLAYRGSLGDIAFSQVYLTDNMTGPTTPTDPSHAAPKKYVDDAIAAAFGNLGSNDYKVYSGLATFAGTGGGTGAVVVQTSIPMAAYCEVGIDIVGQVQDTISPISLSTAAFVAPTPLNVCFISTSQLKPRIRWGRHTASGNLAIVLGDTDSFWNFMRLWVSQLRLDGSYATDESVSRNWSVSMLTSIADYDNLTEATDVTNGGGSAIELATTNPSSQAYGDSAVIGSATTAAKADHKHAMPAAYVHPTGDGNLHVPATGADNSGKVLTAGDTAGSLSWQAVQTSGEFLAVGSIMPWPFVNPPIGWLEMKGQTLSRTTYSALWDYIVSMGGPDENFFGSGDGSTTFTLKDMRGEFIRGWDNGRGIDTDRVLGSSQADELKSHPNHVNDQGGTHIINSSQLTAYATSQFNIYNGNETQVAQKSVGGSETRPRNVSAMWIIKYASVTGSPYNDPLPQATDIQFANLVTGWTATDVAAALTALETEVSSHDASITELNDGYAASKVANGYQKLPSGIILQWYTTGTLTAAATATGNFPMAFPNACLGVVATLKGNNSSGSGLDGIYATAISASQFTVTHDYVTTANNRVVFILAVGY